MSLAGSPMLGSPAPVPSEAMNDGRSRALETPDEVNGVSKACGDDQVASEPNDKSTNDSNEVQEADSKTKSGEDEEPSSTTAKDLETAPAKLIMFTDPSGTKWALPFEQVKTWTQMRAIIKRVYPWRDDLFDFPQAKSSRFHFALILLPGETRLVPELWDEVVEPGISVHLRYEGNLNWLIDILQDERKHFGKNVKDDKDRSQGVAYVARIYQEQSDTRQPVFLREKTFATPLTNLIQALSGDTNAVLQEVRNVFLGFSKQEMAKNPHYDLIHSDDVIGSCVVQINSSILMDALKALVQFQCPDDEELAKYQKYFRDSEFELPGWRNASEFRSGRFIFPFPDLCYHIDELVAYKSSTCASRQRHSKEYNEECDRHIDVLLDYLYNQPSLGLRDAKAAWGQKVPVTTFGWLWLLFKPGSDVYVQERGQLNGYVVETITGMAKSNNTRIKPLKIKVWNLDFDGEKLVRSSKTIVLPAFDGEREILSLPLFPTRFHPDKEGETPLRQALIQRGKTFISVVKKPKYQEYTGNSSFHQGRTFSKSRVIVDHTSKPWSSEIGEEHTNRHIPNAEPDEKLGLHIRIPECTCAVCVAAGASSDTMYRRLTFDDYDNIDLNSCGSLTDHQYFLCFSHVYAYCLQDRLWDLIDVHGLKPPRIERSVIDTLVMRPPSNKAMIKALCETYSQKEDREMLFFADYIRGKGEGQILLLHGPPGTGKTLTAESVAEYTERPLLGITAADLGHEPEQLEKNLLRFFRNANKWDAIVLLDEADVYLERRSVNELRRNSIVSIFLRALDYFQGILFLTTNRVGSFDEAFMSRIHIQIGYEPLDDDSRKQIWMNSFKKLATNHKQGGREIQYSFTAKEFVTTSAKLKELKWNGREIRNAFQTAVALASYEAKQNGESVPTLTEDHFSQVVEMSSNFKMYMKSALQNDDADLAYMSRLRDDKFKRGRDD